MIWWLHVASVWFMTGLIWLIQLVHYPLMDRIPPDGFIEFHQSHSFRITWIVAPVMLLELMTSILLIKDCLPQEPLCWHHSHERLHRNSMVKSLQQYELLK